MGGLCWTVDEGVPGPHAAYGAFHRATSRGSTTLRRNGIAIMVRKFNHDPNTITVWIGKDKIEIETIRHKNGLEEINRRSKETLITFEKGMITTLILC